MDIFDKEALGIRGRFGVDVWERWLSFQHSQEDFLRNYGVREDRIDGTVLALKRLLGDEGIMADKDYHRANRKTASLTSTQFDRMIDYIDEVFGMNFHEYGGSLSDVRLLISDVLYNELLIDVSPDDPLVDDFINEWNMFFAGPNKLAQRNPRRANHKRANALFDRLFSSPGVFSVGSSGDIMAYVDLPSDEIPSGGASFYWVVIDSNGDEIVGGATSSFEEAKSLAENNLFRLSRELYPESYTSRRANRRRSYIETQELWFDKHTGEVFEVIIETDPERVAGYGLTYNGRPLTVSEVAEHDIFTPTHIGLRRNGAFGEDQIRDWGLQPLSHLDKGTTIEIIERNGLPMPASLGHARDSHRANLKVSYSKEDEFEVHDEVVEKFPGGEGALADLFGYTNQDQAEANSAKVMPYIEDAVFSRGGDQDDVNFAYDNLEYHFQTEY